MYKSKKFNVGQRVVVTGNHRFYGGRYKGRYGLLTEYLGWGDWAVRLDSGRVEIFYSSTLTKAYLGWGDWEVRLDSGRVEIFYSSTLTLDVEEDDDLYI